MGSVQQTGGTVRCRVWEDVEDTGENEGSVGRGWLCRRGRDEIQVADWPVGRHPEIERHRKVEHGSLDRGDGRMDNGLVDKDLGRKSIRYSLSKSGLALTWICPLTSTVVLRRSNTMEHRHEEDLKRPKISLLSGGVRVPKPSIQAH